MLSNFFVLALTSLISLNHFYQTKAFLITSPDANDDTWYIGHKKIIRWTSVLTDPSKISLSIVNHDPSTYPTGLDRPIKSGIPKSRSKIVLPSAAVKGLRQGSGYQINIMSEEGGSILAQSPTFTLSTRDSSDTSEISEIEDSNETDDFNNNESSVHHQSTIQGNKPSKSFDPKKDTFAEPYDPKKDTFSRSSESSKTNNHQSKNTQDESLDEDDQSEYGSGKEFNPDLEGFINSKEDDFKEVTDEEEHLNSKDLRIRKKKSDLLFHSIPKFDHSRVACSRTPARMNGARVLRL